MSWDVRKQISFLPGDFSEANRVVPGWETDLERTGINGFGFGKQVNLVSLFTLALSISTIHNLQVAPIILQDMGSTPEETSNSGGPGGVRQRRAYAFAVCHPRMNIPCLACRPLHTSIR